MMKRKNKLSDFEGGEKGMLKKLLLCVLIGGFLNLIPFDKPQAQQGQPTWYIRGQGGILFTVTQLEEDAKVAGVTEWGFLRLVGLGDHIAIGGNYEALNNQGENWRDYRGKVYFFSRNVKANNAKRPVGMLGLWDPKPQIYLTLGPGWTDDAKQGEDGQVSFNSGFGVLFPLWGATPFVEFGGLYAMKEWVFSLTGGLQIGLY